MRYRVLVPAEPTDAIPRGAALLEVDRTGYGLVSSGGAQFGELCAQALREGRRVAIPEGCVEVGYYDAIYGELHPQPRGVAALESWLGRPTNRSDFEAVENRMARCRRARRLLMQGRYAEAARIDPRMGL
ncbi:MAG: hypothetical protein WBV77_14565 [Solirubrobacteraceae bacterium]